MDAVKKRYIAAVSGVKNSGKTTFLEKLIPVLREKGLQVAVIKHDGHDFSPDTQGTDSYRLKQAGAYGCAVFSGNRWMAVKDEAGVDEAFLAQLFPEADMILLEGMKDSVYPKFELVRGEVSQKSVCPPGTLLGLVTDTKITVPGVPVLGMEDVCLCAEILVREWENQTKIVD